MGADSRRSLALLKTGIFTLLVPGTVAFYVPYRMVKHEHGLLVQPHSAWQFAGILPLLTGAAVYLWCAWDFAVTGLGTPAPVDAPRVLIVGGLYRFVRNPMYVGVLSVILGFAIWFASRGVLVYLACVWLAMHLFVRFYEEPHLKRVFGEQYGDYCKRVNRWWPRFRHPA